MFMKIRANFIRVHYQLYKRQNGSLAVFKTKVEISLKGLLKLRKLLKCIKGFSQLSLQTLLKVESLL